jgi:DGQHR domain-containing protein
MAGQDLLQLPALRIRQGAMQFFLAAVDGKLLGRFTKVAHTRRDANAELVGYQRTEILRHVAQIRAYLESPRALMPNAPIIAFDDRVRFRPLEVPSPVSYADFGLLVVPLDQADPVGWLVDGQQRTAAIHATRLDQVPVGIAGFVTASEAEQRDQFLRINATQPLPRSLQYELLPRVQGPLPPALARRREPARLLERLNYDPDSPLFGLVRMTTNPDGVLKDNSLLKALDHSITDGALHRYRDPGTGVVDLDPALRLLKDFWAAVRDVFPDAWNLPPRKSRLLHGVVALGFVMDTICSQIPEGQPLTCERFTVELEPLVEVCCWTGGTWQLSGGVSRPWNQLQNTSQDARLLSDLLVGTYLHRRHDDTSGTPPQDAAPSELPTRRAG